MILLRKAGDRIFIIVRDGDGATAVPYDKLLALKSVDQGASTALTLFWDDDHPVQASGYSVYDLIEAIDDFEISDDAERLLDGEESDG